MTDKVLRIAVLGAGAWGTALACVQARKGHQVTLWGRDARHLAEIGKQGENARYLPGIALPEELQTEADLRAVLKEADIVLSVTPAQSVGEMASQMKDAIDPSTPVILCAKGIDRTTGRLPAETLAAEMPGQSVAALSGPSFAHDVARDLPTAVTLAHENGETARMLARAVSGTSFRVYDSTDLRGVELGGALKNVIALAVGVCRGMKLGASAEAALVARGFAEISRLARALGARPNTLMGLSGLGDLVLTCSGSQSRNFSFGLALGEGRSTASLPLAEGALTAAIASRLADERAVEAPVITTVANLVDGVVSPAQALRDLLARPLKSESEE